jgi:hypothetical protein
MGERLGQIRIVATGRIDQQKPTKQVRKNFAGL